MGVKLTLLAGSLASLLPLAAHAEPPGHAEARALAHLFVQSCFHHLDDANGLRAALSPPAFQPIPPNRAAAMLPRPGRAFRALGVPGHLMVLSFDNGWCGDGGTGIDPRTLTVALSGAMQAHGSTMKLMGANQDGREQRYLLDRPGLPPIALLVLLVPAGSLMQASLFASIMPAAP